MKNTTLRIAASIIVLFLVISCSSSTTIKSGDIVFRGATQSDLSEAINEVTQTEKATNYTHMGICSVEDGSVFVYHSDLGKGVLKEPLELFLKSDDSSTYTADVYRIKNSTQTQIATAISKAKNLVGEPYNVTYILEDKGYYCSEYIYELFKEDNVFTLEPMTFKNAKTNTFHNGWVTHYKDLGIEIPEGKSGCNPNGMAASETLVFVRRLQ
ncbi:YiiX/YebB-like N1pC/P60 family cysteine hydrolase [Winogradskyella marincola]|uniref:YiiX/YebB-like N1pC/P60 family cysteine hydrolase n=1 Tax=Winogradskyella marincola TaxID=3037795 RepID=A0ABT6G065_9FLAO|nr:YiiX/YebB-like N1pC/P60 family cysteine hydrolase [Winogradskyella sp. YYF002]MDG4715429.1 YiiX/YebB-like N1pC/P60 family cysteine hydrolase [Winogradskyella sp. YYF002]